MDVTGVHWTGLPDRTTDQIGKKCPKISESCLCSGSGTIFGQSLDIFPDIFRHFIMILFSGLSNDMPVTTRYGNSVSTPEATEIAKPSTETRLTCYCRFLLKGPYGQQLSGRRFRNLLKMDGTLPSLHWLTSS